MSWQLLYTSVEAVKCGNQLPLQISWQYQEETRECEFYENELEDLSLPLLNRLRVPIEQALRDARLKRSQIDSLVLVGGDITNAAGAANRRASVWQITVSKLRSSTIVALGAVIGGPPAAYAVKILKR